MFESRWNLEVVPRTEIDRCRLPSELQSGPAGYDEHPLVLLLAVPLTVGCRVTAGDDALDSYRARSNNFLDELVWELIGKIRGNIELLQYCHRRLWSLSQIEMGTSFTK